jgi:hypothetical protein
MRPWASSIGARNQASQSGGSIDTAVRLSCSCGAVSMRALFLIRTCRTMGDSDCTFGHTNRPCNSHLDIVTRGIRGQVLPGNTEEAKSWSCKSVALWLRPPRERLLGLRERGWVWRVAGARLDPESPAPMPLISPPQQDLELEKFLDRSQANLGNENYSS